MILARDYSWKFIGERGGYRAILIFRYFMINVEMCMLLVETASVNESNVNDVPRSVTRDIIIFARLLIRYWYK